MQRMLRSGGGGRGRRGERGEEVEDGRKKRERGVQLCGAVRLSSQRILDTYPCMQLRESRSLAVAERETIGDCEIFPEIFKTSGLVFSITRAR